MRKIAANMIFPVSSPPIKNGYIVVDEHGKIIDVVDTGATFHEIAGLEFYNGVLIPGFVNAHCQIELSHLKGKIEKGQGLSASMAQISQLQNTEKEIQLKAAKKMLNYMWLHGINGLGDVMNTHVTSTLKQSSRMLSHSFIELFTSGNKDENEIVADGLTLLAKCKRLKINSSLTPGAMSAVSDKLLDYILSKNSSLASIHFLESKQELAFDILGFLDRLKTLAQILFVHNLYMNASLFDHIEKHELYNRIFWVLCPNSNRYIENEMPDFTLFKGRTNVCLGTDSLASNQQLSLLEEMKTVAIHGLISFEELLKWATLNGARALKMDAELGSFEQGKSPGVLLLSGYNIKTRTLNKDATIKRLI